MSKRGRTSAAELQLVATPRAPIDHRRPVPPGDLTREQADEWCAYVARCPPGWFPRETYPLLAEYCRCAVSLRRLNKIVDRLKRVDEEYTRVFGLIERERKLLVSLGRSMRLTQQATYDKKKSKGPTIAAPWDEE